MENTYYIIIPPEIRQAPDLNPTQKLLMGEIITLSKNQGVCWASNAYLAKIYELSRRSIITQIKDLESKGYVKIDYVTKDNITHRTITPLVKIQEQGVVKNFHRGVKNLHRGGEKISQGGVKNLHPNNTSNNNTSIIISDVINFFDKEGSNHEIAKDFFYYYDSIGWKVGKNPVMNWKALAKKWISNNKPKPKMKVLE